MFEVSDRFCAGSERRGGGGEEENEERFEGVSWSGCAGSCRVKTVEARYRRW